jgi:hypothetical protein
MNTAQPVRKPCVDVDGESRVFQRTKRAAVEWHCKFKGCIEKSFGQRNGTRLERALRTCVADPGLKLLNRLGVDSAGTVSGCKTKRHATGPQRHDLLFDHRIATGVRVKTQPLHKVVCAVADLNLPACGL